MILNQRQTDRQTPKGIGTDNEMVQNRTVFLIQEMKCFFDEFFFY